MNPGDWTNCVPENIKAFETVYNEATKENVTGSYGLLDMTNNASNKTYIVAGWGFSTGASTTSGKCICVSFDPSTGEQLEFQGLNFNNSSPAFNYITSMRNKSYIVRKIYSYNGSRIDIFTNNAWITPNEGATIVFNNTSQTALVFKLITVGGANIGYGTYISLEEVE